MISIVQATAADVDVWRSLRRDGIMRYPNAFILSLDEHDAGDPAEDRARLASGGRFLALSGQTAVGMIGLNTHGPVNMRHRAEVGPLYVTPDYQGSDVAKQLFRTAVAHAARAGLRQLELAVNEANARAVAFYLREGFTQYGRLPNAVIGENGPEHDLLLLRILPQPS